MIFGNTANSNKCKPLIPKLSGEKIAVKVCVRSEAAGKPLKVAGVEDVLVGAFSHPAMMGHAAEGAGKVFRICLTVRSLERALGRSLIDASSAAGFGIERRHTTC